jgi:hypothetical protein
MVNVPGARSGIIGSDGGIGYEEGLWTPVVDSSDGDDAFDGNYDEREGIYTKIGNMVTCMCFINAGTKGSVSGAVMRVSGLPFTPSGDPTYSACAIGYWTNVAIGARILYGVVYSSNSFVYLFKSQDSGTGVQIVPSEISSDFHLSMTMSYQTNL